MKPLFVHVGLPRAGSTFFQNRVFQGKRGICYLGKTQEDYPEWLMKWHYLPEIEFAEQADRIREELSSRCSTSKPNILSSEMFTMWGGKASEQARRLYQLFPDARIVIVLREPVSRMVSFYKAIVERDGFFLPLRKMIDWKEIPFVDYKRKPVQILDFQYDRTVAAYRRLFGKERVCVLKLEDMKEMPRSFWGQLSDFSRIGFGAREITLSEDASVNASPTNASMGRLRWQNFQRLVKDAWTDSPSHQNHPECEEWSSEEIVSSSLREQLESSLRNRCAYYYG